MKMKYSDLMKKLFISCLERLVKLIELDTPLVIIGKELSMLVFRGLGYLGKNFTNPIFDKIIYLEKNLHGYCIIDGCENPSVDKEYNLCQEHLDEDLKYFN